MHNLTPGVVLIVDDEPSLRTITRRMLERKGFDCIEAVDGIDGIAKLEQHQDRIDLVLLDMMMPRMTGLDAYVRMRQIRAELPIIILSGFSESDMGTRFPSDKRLKYLHKPFTVKEVSSMIEDVMQ